MSDHNEHATISGTQPNGLEIAIIGMAGRFPGARNVEQFWENIKNGVESIDFFSDEELLESGVDPGLLKSPGYIKARGLLEGIEYFDAHFFDYLPHYAEYMDPQVRILHECTWEALENAGYNPEEYEGLIGLYAGSSFNMEWMKRLFTLEHDSLLLQEIFSLNLREYLSARISYKFNLRGPSINVSAACSTSLVAVHLACQGLLNGECNIALAGAVTVSLPEKGGYLFHEGMLSSPDGHTRAFDADAGGTVFNSGAGIVVLKTLEDAVTDRDTIYAVIKGSSTNNDGTQKIGFTAPSVSGQIAAVKAAHFMADVEPSSIGYVETHGTGTPVGDSIEIEALTRAFNTTEKGSCPIGSVKTNVGHLETAAGAAGIIKTALSLKYRTILPSLNFLSPSHEIDFADSPFFVNTQLKPWETHRLPRRAGVNSFGIGGNNAYVILEEWPEHSVPVVQSRQTKEYLILLSARTRSALKKMAENLAKYLEKNPGVNLADVAYTLQVGRKIFEYRTSVLCTGVEDAIKQLSHTDNLEICYWEKKKNSRRTFTHPGRNKGPDQGNGLLLKDVNRLWMQGTKINWEEFYQGEKRFRIPLPTYPFEGQYYWELMSGKAPEVPGAGISWQVSTRPKRPRPPLEDPYEAPANETEKALAEIWQNYFLIEPIGVLDDFFQLGGDSLKGMIMLSLVRKELELKTSIREFFQNPTIRGLAGSAVRTKYEEYPLEPVEMKEYYRLSPAQKRLFTLQLMYPKLVSYNENLGIIIKGDLDKKRFEQVSRQLLQRHESLRTSFEMIEGEPIQRVHHDVDFEIEYENLEQASGEEFPDSPHASSSDPLASVIKTFIRPFDLLCPPLVRMKLLDLGKGNYILLIDSHHIVMDGISFTIFTQDFIDLYRGETLPALTFQYRDYVEWQHKKQQVEAAKKQQEYWSAVFDGDIPVLNLPTDYERPVIQSFEGDAINFDIDNEKTMSLKRLAEKEGVTLYMVLLGVLNILLAILSDQEDIVIGTAEAGRNHPELRQVIGMFVHTLAMRNYPNSRKSFTEFLQEIKENTLNVFENRDYPFEDLVEQVSLGRDASRNPLFDVIFVLQNIDFPRVDIPGLALKDYPYKNNISKFDLKLQVIESGDKLLLTFEYCSKLFKQATIEKFIVYFKNIVTAVLKEPASKISELEIISEEEMKQILYDFNDTDAEYPQNKTIYQLFEEQEGKNPDNVAVVIENRQLSYSELNRKSNQLAGKFRARGVKPGTIIGIILERSIETMIAILSILKSGAAYLPIDGAHPESRKKFMIRDSGVEILLTQENLLDENKDALRILSPGNIFSVGDPGIYSEETSNPELINSPEDLCYVIYTSGTTGKPKGVMLGHRGVVNYVWWAAKNYVRNEKVNFPLYTSTSFDLTVTSIFTPLITGNTIVVYGDDNHEPVIEKVIEENRVEVVKLTPSHLKLIRDKKIETKYSGIKRLILGGENLESSLTREIFETFHGNIEIYNEYGPTETVVGCMIHRFDPGKSYGRSMPIGFPADNANIYILNSNRNLSPPGAIGEIYIAGDGVARGYLNRPELSRDSFAADPFKSGERMYRTGDLARRNPDGNIEFIGRRDQQVKIRGYRVELAEIENVLKNYKPAINPETVLTDDTTVKTNDKKITRCTRCLLPANYPGISFDEEGTCNVCKEFDGYEKQAMKYFKKKKDFLKLVETARGENQGEYDCLLLFSGGKDSTYVLYQLIEMGLKVLTFTFDNGYISDAAFTNIKKTTEKLGVDNIIAAVDNMNEVFVESLKVEHNVCHGCWHALNTLGAEIAGNKGINMVVSGLSKGQIFDMRLHGLFQAGVLGEKEIEKRLLMFRKTFHSMENRFSRILNIELEDENVEKIYFVDFFRYFDTPVNEIKEYLYSKEWIQPEDTGFCSSNCIINDIGIYMHLKSRYYHFYAAPLSWDCRLGIITREDGIREMQFNNVDLKKVNMILDEIGYYSSSNIRDAVVVDRKTRTGDIALCAYIVSDMEFTVPQLRNHLSEILPDYMIPAYFVKLDTIPLTPNGKVDRKALPDPEINRDIDYFPPTNNIEKKLLEPWSEVLGVDKDSLSIDANFFELGGHSLSAIMLSSKLQKEFNVRLKIEDIFKFPTIRTLGSFLKSVKKEMFVSIKQAEEKEYYCLSSAQKRLYILSRMEPESTAYNMPERVVLEGELKTGKLKEIFKKLMKRHSSLRTSFILIEDDPVQVVHKNVEFEIEYYQSLVSSPQSETSIIKNFTRPFDLSQAPLLRVGLVKIGETRHILMFDTHHIISDGISNSILIRDFMALYKGKEIAPLPLQYKDFSVWQNLDEQRKGLESQREYWLKKFEGEIPVLNLITDYTRPAVQSFSGDAIDFEIGIEETRALKQLAKKEGATLYIVLLAAFNVLFMKLSGQEDIIIGTPVAGRRHVDIEQIIGVFINTLAMRNYPKSEEIFINSLQRVTKSTLEAFENQDYPFEELIEQVSVNRDVSRNPLFDVMFVLQNLEFPKIEIPGLKLSPYKYKNRVSKFDLVLSAVEAGEKLLFTFEYCTKLFKQKTIERFAFFYKKIVSSILDNPNKKIIQIEIISEKEKKQILFDFNDTAAEYPKNKTTHELFEEQAARTPDNIAAVGVSHQLHERENISLTYKELDRKSNQLTYLLKEKSVLGGNVIGIMVERSVEMIIGILGILKAGGAYLPIEPDYPGERIKYMLEDSSTNVLVTINKLAEECEELGWWEGEKIILEELFESLSTSPTLPPFHPSTLPSSSLAYIIYTSGTTGKPKGVLVNHCSIVNTLFALFKEYPFSERDVYLLKTSYVFDVSVSEIFGWFWQGGRLAILESEAEKNPVQMLKAIEHYRITHINFVPSMFQAFLDHLDDKNINKLSMLKYIFLAGEALPISIAQRIEILGTKVISENIYGPTEAAVYASKYSLQNWKETANIPIGKPLNNTRIYILNNWNNVQPIGIPGELCIAGPGLARGYLNHPELTAVKFRRVFPNDKCPMTNDRLYFTGDLARWLSDGNIEFLGRIDRQVKIRGFRIELDEIESQLLNHNKIKETVVMLRENPGVDKYICAYFVSEKEFTVSQLRSYLSKSLPDYMLPSYFVPLEKIPLNVSGKVERKALPEPELMALSGGGDYTAPRNIIEKELTETWQKVLGRETVCINDNFFEIGGDSIKAVQVISRMKKAGYKIKMKDIFRNPRISALAHLVKKTDRKADQSVITGTIPLTPIQEHFFEKQMKDKHHYNHAVMLTLEEGFDEETAKAIFTKIQEHHDALRITYKEIDGEIIQINNGLDYPLSLVVYNLRNQENAKEAVESLANKSQASINLETGPLMKLGLFLLQDRHHLLIVIHHLVIDGVSWRILFEDIATLYQQCKKGEALVLPLKTDSFKIWAEKLTGYAGSGTFLTEKSYWGELESEPIPGIRKDFENEDNYMRDVKSLSFSINEKETNLLLTKVNEAFGTEINDILLTALGFGFKKTFGNDRLLIALEGHGREEILEDVDISRTVGWFTSLYPVQLDFSYESAETNDRNLSRQIKVVKEICRQVPSKGVGYGILKYLTSEKYKREINFRLNPQIVFNYLGQFDEDLGHRSFSIAKESAGYTHSPDEQREFELEVSGMITGQRLVMSITYNATQYRAEIIEELWHHCKNALSHIISYCSGRDARELTPSDFTYSQLSIEAVEQLQKKFSNKIEDIYPLSPMQEGMLFHSLYDRHSLAYFEQISYRLKGELDEVVFEKSLKKLMERYDILRTVFVHEDLERPLQIALENPQLDFMFEDACKMAEQEGKRLEEYLKEFKEKDRQRSFDLRKDLLMRVSLIQVAKAEYEVIWSFHHILMDGWCIGILNSDFFKIYDSLYMSRSYRLPEVKPYRTYIQWLQKQDQVAAKLYWREYLIGYEEPVGIPQKKKFMQGDEQHYKKETVSFSIEREKTNHLKKLSGKMDITMNTIIQAVWGVILGKYNNSGDVLFGGVVSGRPPEIVGVEIMVGLFINTTPVRIQFEEKEKFNNLLLKVQEKAVESGPYQYCPLAEIQSESVLKKNLLNHIFIFENYPIREELYEKVDGRSEKNGKVKLELSGVDVFEQTNYDFNLIIAPGEQLTIRFDYNANVYECDFIRKVADNFEQVLIQVLNDPEQEIGKLTILSEEEKKQILFDFNDTDAEYPQNSTIHGLFEEQVERTPDHVALVGQRAERNAQYEDEKRSASCTVRCALTYKELNRKSNQLAYLLKEKGVEPDSIIGIVAERSVEMIIGIFGILKASGAYLPIDPGYPRERINYMLADSSAKVLVTTRILAEEGEKVRIWEGETIILEELFETLGSSPTLPPFHPSTLTSSSLAYIIYTSGTTGKPKGILVSHRNVNNYSTWFKREFQIGVDDKFCFAGSFCFDMSVTPLIVPLISGASIYTAREKIEREPQVYTRFLAENRVSIVKLTPTQFRTLQDFIEDEDLGSLRYIILGGEAVDVNDIRHYLSIYKQQRIVNEYGPTEATVATVFHVVGGNDFEGTAGYEPTRSSLPIGRPVSNTRVYILDKYTNLVPIGVVGELCIGGESVAPGYLNKPELTKEKFQISNYKQSGALRADFRSRYPNTPIPHYPIYKTGDLARWLPDGNIEFLGRIDHQVKIRGFRIELGEIGNQLLNHREIKEAVVLAKEDNSGNNYLCAYIVSEKEFTVSQLRSYLAKSLPDYMIPSYFMPLEKIPLTSNGKMDRKALPDPEIKTDNEYLPPMNSVEEKLVEIWSDVLGANKDTLGISANFFDLGGHSLTAINLISKLKREFDVKLKLTDIFKFPTIRMFGQLLRLAEKEKFVPIKQAEKKEYYSLSPVQKSLYVLQQFDLHSIAYNIPQIVVLEGKLERDVLENVFKKLIKRHESLRTAFRLEKGKPVQQIHEEVDFEIRDYASHSQYSPEEVIEGFIRPFNLARAPLIRVGLIKEKEEKHLLIVDIHHIISDGVSHSILVQDFMTLYEGKQLPSLKLQYKDYSQWQNTGAQKKSLEIQKKYWLKRFEGEIPLLDIQPDYPRPSLQSFAGNSIDFELDKEMTGRLKDMVTRHGTTLYTLLLALFNILLSRISRQEDIIVGTPVAGRRHADLEQVIGMFVNTLALRNYPKGGELFVDFLKGVKENTLKALENQDYPFEDLVEQIEVNRDVSRNPLFDVMFVLQNVDSPQIEIPGLKLMPYGYANNIAKFDLTLASVELEEKLLFTFEYCTEIFKLETIERFIKYFKKVISEVIKNPGEKISKIEIITGEEKKKILHDFNDTGTGYPKGKSIHQLFEEQVDEVPDHTALIGQIPNKEGTGELAPMMSVHVTYKELNEKSNQLAHLLMGKGVQPDAIVGIMVERSIEMIIGIMGILKSGGAYLPIEPGYPDERINYMLTDSGAKVLLASPVIQARVKSEGEAKFIEIIDISDLLSSSTSISRLAGSADNLAYLIYTSGTTGKPKGTLVSHRNVNNYSTWFKREFQIGVDDKFCFAGSFCFDMSVTTLIVPLISGASIYTAREKIERDPQVYTRFLAENRVSIVKLTPTQFRPLQDFIEDEDLGSLRYIILGGEAVDVNDIRHYLSIYKEQRIVNEYGPTEATVATVFHVVSGNDFEGTVGYEPTRSSLPIGRPVSNTRIYILDKYTNLVPPGVVGELCIGGESVAPGYLNKPELTAEKFIKLEVKVGEGKTQKDTKKFSPHLPTHLLTYSPIYRTGDLSRWLPNGNIQYLGRIDNQVKIRGYRIELEEIEAVLAAHEGVKAGAAAVKNDPAGNDVLAAYIIPEQGETTTRIREYLENRLPGYMVPSPLVIVDELPVTASGKIDRKKLPELSDLQPTGSEPYRKPSVEEERILANTWKGVLGINNVGIDDNFFQLGGDSIKAIQVVSRLRKYKYTLKISDLFLHPTVKKLTKFMKKLEKAIDQGLAQGEVELTPIQKWFFEKYFINSNNNFAALQHYNQSVMLYRREGFDRNAVEQVFRGILLHHDALRMVYSLKKGKVVQRNRGLEGKLFELETMDLRDAADIKTNIEVQIQRAANRLQRGMDLLNGPLVRLGLFKTNQGDHLLIAVHHLVVDGVSWRILLEDFSSGYQQAVNHQSVKFQEKTDSFQYWAAKLKEYAKLPEALKELEYWKRLKETGSGELPVDHPLPAGQSDQKKWLNREIVTMELPEIETVKLLRKVNRPYRTENNDILLAALGLAIKEWGGLNRLSIHLEGHGREEILEGVSISRTIGWFTTLFPVTLDLTRTTELSYFIKQVKETLRQIPGRGIGYGILKYLTGGNTEEITVEPGISFNYLGEFGQDHHANSPIFEFSHIKSGDNINTQLKGLYHLDINGMVVSGKLTLSFGYNKYEYKRDTIERLVECCRSNLGKIIEHCMAKSQGELTPSDLDYSEFTINELSLLENKFREKNLIIQNIYRLSPMQSGMFYHYLMDNDTSLYFEQYEISLQGWIDRDLLEKSLNKLLERYDVLRTIFVQEYSPEPLQIVVKQRHSSIQFVDISTLPGEALDQYIESFKQEDRDRGFDLARDILIRIALLKIGIDSYKIIFSFHHIIMDGWCTGIIFKDLLHIYGTLREQQPIRHHAVKPYSQYIKWLDSRDKESALEFWKQYLHGYQQSIELPKSPHHTKNLEHRIEKYQFFIDEELTDHLVTLANENQVTVNTIIETIWGLLLQKLNQTMDVVFGKVVSGRPPMDDMEYMVGLFINTIPIRIRVEKEKKTFCQLTRDVQQRALFCQPHEYLPLAEIESCSPLKSKLLDHIMIFENYPVQEELRSLSGTNPTNFEVVDVEVFTKTNYHFNLAVAAGKTISITFIYNSEVYDTHFIKKTAFYLKEIINQVLTNRDIDVKDIQLIGHEPKAPGEVQLLESTILDEAQGDFGF